MSSRTSLFVTWPLNSDSVSPGGLITGYQLVMDDGYGGEFVKVLDTVSISARINEFYAANLTQGLIYRFKVRAYNYNDEPGAYSVISSFMACDVPSRW